MLVVDAKVNPQHRKDVFLFLQELCNIPKSIQMTYRTQFYQTLIELNLFRYLETALLSGGPRKQYLSLVISRLCFSGMVLFRQIVHDNLIPLVLCG